MRRWKEALGAVALGCTFAGGSVALAAASTPAPGKIKVFVSQINNTKSKILVTGAIGDYGTGVSTDKNGKVDSNGAFQKVTLKQGGFVVDATAFNRAINHLSPQTNKATCSLVLSGSGSGTLEKGTGLYQGIGGKLTITVTFAGIAPRFTSGAKKGQCNFAQNVQPFGAYQAITATGNVTFG
jgi:hypothetical protein